MDEHGFNGPTFNIGLTIIGKNQKVVQQSVAIVKETNDYLLSYYSGKFDVVVNEVIYDCTKRVDVSRYNSCSSILSFFLYIMFDIIIKHQVC